MLRLYYQIMLLLYINVIYCNLTLLNFIVVFSWKFELCLLPNYVAILFLRVLATGSGLGEKNPNPTGVGVGVILSPE
jgi:hypothetical protein